MLIVDANIVIAALLKDSKTRQIIVSGKFELASPDYRMHSRKPTSFKGGMNAMHCSLIDR